MKILLAVKHVVKCLHKQCIVTLWANYLLDIWFCEEKCLDCDYPDIHLLISSTVLDIACYISTLINVHLSLSYILTLSMVVLHSEIECRLIKYSLLLRCSATPLYKTCVTFCKWSTTATLENTKQIINAVTNDIPKYIQSEIWSLHWLWNPYIS